VQIDTEVLALFVQVAAFQAQRLRGVGDVIVVPAELGQNRLALKRVHTDVQAASNFSAMVGGTRGKRGRRSRGRVRQSPTNRRGIY
jgi:hypothetical protein